jgi:short-subunit dehydrogenase
MYDEAGRIDVLVNNAGYALSGAFEDLSISEIRKQYETNV